MCKNIISFFLCTLMTLGVSSLSATVNKADLPDLYECCYQHCSPSVVFLHSEEFPQDDSFFSRYFSYFQSSSTPISTKQGAGFFFSSDGYIVTNAHLVAGMSRITVFLANGQSLPATLIGADMDTNVAVIKVKATQCPTLSFSQSEQTKAGSFIFTLSKPLQDQPVVLTMGTISQVGKWQHASTRTLKSYTRTNILIDPLHFGAPLLNLEGEVIGMHTVVLAPRTGKPYGGENFAIPSSVILESISQIFRETGE